MRANSPFRRHQQTVNALLAGAATVTLPGAAPEPPSKDTPEGQEYATLRVLLHDNLRQLSDVQSVEARNPLKAEFAKAFAPWIEGVLEAGKESAGAQDEILIQNMIWAIDYRDFEYALLLGAHALTHNLVLPERFNRTVACFLLEEIATISLDDQDAVTHEQLLQVAALTLERDMPDPAKAKLHKAVGRSFDRKAQAFDPAADSAPAGGKSAYLEAAMSEMQIALKLDRNVGVKKDLERLGRELHKLSAEKAE